MSAPLHIVGFSGSLRKHSYNSSLLRLAGQFAREHGDVEFEILDPGTLPLFNQDFENDPPESVRHFKDKIREADAVIMAVPEYNYSFSGVLKNAIDWASRPAGTSELTKKPVAIMGAGGRVGTARAQLHLRQVLLYVDADVLTKPEVLILNSWEKFDSEGNLVNELDREQVETLVNALIRHVRESGRDRFSASASSH